MIKWSRMTAMRLLDAATQKGNSPDEYSPGVFDTSRGRPRQATVYSSVEIPARVGNIINTVFCTMAMPVIEMLPTVGSYQPLRINLSPGNNAPTVSVVCANLSDSKLAPGYLEVSWNDVFNCYIFIVGKCA
jgi:hypothetical protein